MNRIGTTIQLTGHQCFVKVNATLLTLAQAVVTAPPALPAWVACTVTALSSAAGTAAMALAGANPASGTLLMLYASPQLSPGVSFNASWKYIGHNEVFTGSTMDILALYEAVYGAPIAGKKVMVKVVQVKAGMSDNGTVYTCIVAA